MLANMLMAYNNGLWSFLVTDYIFYVISDRQVSEKKAYLRI